MKRIALALVIATLTAGTAIAGPPWITIEVRPMGGSFVVAHTYHHGTPMALPLTGTAEGLVDGQRRSVALRFDTTSESNAFAVARSWGESGVWVLNIGTDAGDHGTAGVVVGVDRTGQPAFVRFPRSHNGFSRMATAGEINSMLRTLDAGQQVLTLGALAR
ncbi:MAG TPA: hypothetical protein VGI92_04695 [Gemmatimonadales bacterium]|jgi:hypothetical protein